MGIFSSIGKFFKKIVKGVGKAIKGVVKGVKKVVKKISKSKILKALAIAAAVVVTGGAAIGAFGGSLATSTFGQFMIGASQKLAGGALFGTGATGAVGALQTAGKFASKVLFKPFATAGKFAGSALGGVTDFAGITTKAKRMGYTAVRNQAGTITGYKINPDRVFDAEGTFDVGDLKDKTFAEFQAETAGKFIDPVTGEWADMPSTQVFSTGTPSSTYGPRDMTPAEISDKFGSGIEYNEAGDLVHAETGKVVASSSGPTSPSLLERGKDWAVSTTLSTVADVGKGYLLQQLEDESGRQTDMATESKEYQDALQIYAAQQGTDIAGIYNNLAFGNADPGFVANSALYTQSTFNPGAVVSTA